MRPSYLSNTRSSAYNELLTDKQRDEIDYETRLIIQQQMNRLRSLEEREKQRLARVNKGPMIARFLRDPRKEGIEKTLELHRAGMFWYLNEILRSVSQMHASQQEIRLSRQLEKSKSSLHHIPRTVVHRKLDGVPEEPAQMETQQLDAVQIQELVSENNAILEELEVTHDKVKQAEKSMYEISELQTNLAAHLATQNDKIHGLLEDAFRTSSDVSAANEQLASARKRNRRASKIIIYSSVSFGLILLFYDKML
jgi:syntaxin 18